MALSVITTNNATGTQTVTVRPVSVTIGQDFILSLFGVEVEYTAAAATAADVVAGLAAAIAGSSDPEWSSCTTEIGSDGESLLISYSTTAGDLKIWRGDAPAVAQVTRLTPVNVQIGNVFSCRINGKPISVVATVASASSVATLLKNAIDASTIPEFAEFDAVVEGGSVVLTASTAGVPFEIVSGAGNGAVEITRQNAGSSGSNAVQRFQFPVSMAGTFKIGHDDQITTAIAAGASAATVQAALEALSRIGSGNVAVARTTVGADYVYEITFDGALGLRPVAPVQVIAYITAPIIQRIQTGSATGDFQNDIQRVLFGSGTTSETTTLTNATGTTSGIAAIDSESTVQAALYATGDYTNTLSVTKGTITAGVYFDIEFPYFEGNATQPLLTGSTFSGAAVGFVAATVEILDVGTWSINEMQGVTLVGGPTGGTFTLSLDGQTTSALAYNVSAANMQTALLALSNIGAGDVSVTGSDGGPWVVEFIDDMAATPQNLLTSVSSLTGGVSDSLIVLTTTESRGPNHWDDPLNWSPVGVPVDFDRVRFESGRSDCLYGLDQSAIILTELEFLAAYTGNVGLPRDNSNGYREYRTRDLTVNVPSVLIGHGDGSGSGKIQLNTLTTTVYMEIRNTGGSREIGVPAVTWFGNNQASEIVFYAGEFGVAIWSDQLAVLNKIEQYGGQLRADHCTLQYLYAPGQSWTAHEMVCSRIEA